MPASREFVILRTPVIFGCAPPSLYIAFPFQPVQRRVQRTLAKLQRVAGYLLHTVRDSPPVLRLKCERLQYQQVERSLRKIDSISSPIFPFRFYMNSISQLLSKCKGTVRQAEARVNSALSSDCQVEARSTESLVSGGAEIPTGGLRLRVLMAYRIRWSRLWFQFRCGGMFTGGILRTPRSSFR